MSGLNFANRNISSSNIGYSSGSSIGNISSNVNFNVFSNPSQDNSTGVKKDGNMSVLPNRNRIEKIESSRLEKMETVFTSKQDVSVSKDLSFVLCQISPLRLGHTGKQICYGRKTDKTCRIWLSSDKIHLL